MLRRYSKARSTAGGSTNGVVSNNFKPPNLDIYEKRIQDLSKAVEESQKNADRVSFQQNQYEMINVTIRAILVKISHFLGFDCDN